jgi:cellobiose phosphorylase
MLLAPCIPTSWPGFAIRFRYHTTRYAIQVENPNHVSHGIVRAELDGSILPGDPGRIPLADDGEHHHLRILLG